MAAVNPTMTDPKSESVSVKNHAANAADAAHQGQPTSSTSHSTHAPTGLTGSNTSTSLTGAGATQPGAGVDAGVDAGAGDTSLKTPRKQDGPAHAQSAGSLHASGAGHAADFK